MNQRQLRPPTALFLAFAQRVQEPGVKLNHALVLGGLQGIGKDTLLEPVKRTVGPWNWSEVSPKQMLDKFNGRAAAVVTRVSEAHDLGDIDRFAFYEHSKAYIAAPPDTISCNEKFMRPYPVVNVMGVIITTNHRTDGIYLPADDRRHFVAWSTCEKSDFDEAYWVRLWGWIEGGGTGNVGAFLRGMDLSAFNPNAAPPKTEAWHAVVGANLSSEDSGLSAVLDGMGAPDVVTLEDIQTAAAFSDDPLNALFDRNARRRIPHVMDRAGYVQVRNPDADDGLWKLAGKRQTLYGKKSASFAEHTAAARRRVAAAAKGVL